MHDARTTKSRQSATVSTSFRPIRPPSVAQRRTGGSDLEPAVNWRRRAAYSTFAPSGRGSSAGSHPVHSRRRQPVNMEGMDHERLGAGEGSDVHGPGAPADPPE